MENPIGWIEIPVTDMDRAEKFYTAYFGHELQRQEEQHGILMSWFPMSMDGYGSAATLIKGDDYRPSHEGTLVYFPAPGGTIDAALEKAKEQGITILLEKMNIGTHGYIAWIEDSEGNRIALHSQEG